jgi:hypothetical protein
MTFGLAIMAAQWLMGARSLAGVVTSHWFLAVFVVWNGVLMSWVAIFIAIRQKRAEKSEERNRRDLPSASERLKQEVQRGD